MSLRNQFQPHVTHRPPTYYANNRLYKNSNAQTDVPGRTSRRIHEGLSVDRNYGLDTTSDDLNSSPYSSPYYVNGRYNASNQVTQTGNSSSVQGTKLLLTLNDERAPHPVPEVATTLKLWQGKQIRFEVPYSGKVVGAILRLKNTGGSTGILSIYLSASKGGPTLAEMAIDLCTVSQDNMEERMLYTMTPVAWDANPRGKLYARMEIWGEVSCKKSTNPYNTGKLVEIESCGDGPHEEWVYKLGEKNVPVHERPSYVSLPNQPTLGFVYNSWSSVPTNRIEGVDYGASVSLNGYLYDLFCIKNATEAKVIVYDRQTNTVLPESQVNIPIDAQVESLNLVQAADYVYYVDGYSALRKFKIGEWQAEEVTSANPPVLAPSIITFHANRIWLAGFRYDPNLVQYSEITENGPEYDNFLWRFYSPDQSPLATSDEPIVAMVEYQPDRLMIATTGNYNLYATSADPATELPQQVSVHSDGAGVASAGDIVSYRGVIYSFDPDEGIRRFTGSLWNKIPAALDSHIERVDMTKPRKLWGYAYKLYFNYTDRVDGRAKCMVWDMEMNYQQYPWFMDSDLPFCDVRANNDYELIGIHPDFPCIMKLYAEDTWRRLDTPITFRRDTKFLSLPGNAADMILQRVYTKVISNATRQWFIGLSFDRDNLDPDRGTHSWYRQPTWATEQLDSNIEDPFSQEDIYEQYATSLLALPNLNARAMSTQVRVQTKTFRSQANLVSVLLEARPRNYN